MGLHEEFEAHPVAFLRKYALDPGDLHPRRPRPLDRRGADQIFSPNISKHYFERPLKYGGGVGSVKGITHRKFEDVLSTFKFVRAGEGNVVHLEKVDDVTEWGVDMYYLPWEPQAVTSMTLPGNLGGDYFTTASLSGCSVFVRGNADNPTIYHAGCESKSKYETTELWRACIRKLGVNHATPNFYGIDKYDYKKARARGVKEDTSLQEAIHSHNYGGYKKLIVMESAGCVVGIKEKDTKRWNFYLQERCQYKILEIGTGASHVYWTPVSLRRFFPTGAKHVQLLRHYQFR